MNKDGFFKIVDFKLYEFRPFYISNGMKKATY
jgi:hypothetical protein